MFYCTLLDVHSSIAIFLMGKRELVVLLNMSSWCLVMVERLFLAVPWGCLRFVIVVFPDHTHLLFLKTKGFGLLFEWSLMIGFIVVFILHQKNYHCQWRKNISNQRNYAEFCTIPVFVTRKEIYIFRKISTELWHFFTLDFG